MELIERIQSQENSDTYSVAFLEKEREVSNLIFTAFLVPVLRIPIQSENYWGSDLFEHTFKSVLLVVVSCSSFY